jgi:hypothetical protein
MGERFATECCIRPRNTWNAAVGLVATSAAAQHAVQPTAARGMMSVAAADGYR